MKAMCDRIIIIKNVRNMDFAFVVSLTRVCRKNQQVVRISTVIQFSYPARENGKVNSILLIRKAEANVTFFKLSHV